MCFFTEGSAGEFLEENYFITSNEILTLWFDSACGSGWQPVAFETEDEGQFVAGLFPGGARN